MAREQHLKRAHRRKVRQTFAAAAAFVSVSCAIAATYLAGILPKTARQRAPSLFFQHMDQEAFRVHFRLPKDLYSITYIIN